LKNILNGIPFLLSRDIKNSDESEIIEESLI
jgi:hypothetical protein